MDRINRSICAVLGGSIFAVGDEWNELLAFPGFYLMNFQYL